MVYIQTTNSYWKGLGWIIGAYILLQLVYRIPVRLMPGVVHAITIHPLWLLLPVVYLWIGGKLKRLNVPWMYACWHMVHVMLLTLTLGMIGYNRFIGSLPYGMHFIATSMTEFLISPVLYICLGLLYRAP